MKRYVMLSVLLMVSACVHTSGTEVSESQLATIHKGTTTYDEVIKSFGPPQKTTVGSSGNKRIVYTYRRESFDAGDFAAAMVTPLGQEDDHIVAVVIDFDQNNIVSDFASSTSDRRHQ